jgi:hypothetical protein
MGQEMNDKDVSDLLEAAILWFESSCVRLRALEILMQQKGVTESELKNALEAAKAEYSFPNLPTDLHGLPGIAEYLRHATVPRQALGSSD